MGKYEEPDITSVEIRGESIPRGANDLAIGATFNLEKYFASSGELCY